MADNKAFEKDGEPEQVKKFKSVTMIKGIDDEEIDTRCGYVCCKPDCCQSCNTSKGLTAAIFVYTIVYGMIFLGVGNVIIAPLQRRYQFSSVQVVMIPASQDIFGGVFAIIFGYIGTFYHKGRLLSLAALGQAFGCFMFLLVHLVSPLYDIGMEEIALCDPDGDTECLPDGSNYNIFFWMFILGQLGNGLAGGIMFAVAIPYIDENVKAKNTPLYIGLFYAFTAVGVMIGYIVGGLLLTVFVDIGRVDMNDVPITIDDPRWVGAWWISYIIGLIGAIGSAIYLLAFPKQIPAAARYQAERRTEAYGGGEEVDTREGPIKKLWKSTKILMTNPTFDLLTIGGIIEMGHLMGFIIFFPMIITFQFDQNPARGAVISGLVIVPAAIAGQIVGGLVPRRLKSKVRGLLIQTGLCSLAVALMSPVMLLRCPTPAIAGVNRAFHNSSIEIDLVNLTAPCNEDCGCDTRVYDPICATNDIQYFTPCHAACVDQDVDNDGNDVFYNCDCIPPTTEEFDAVLGTCDSDCNLFPIFLVVFFFAVFLIFMSLTSGIAATVRCVPETERSYAVGLQATIVRFLGTATFPILFGAIFDSSCLLWQYTCEDRGACWIYDTATLARGLALLTFICKGVGCIFTFSAAIVYKPPPESETILDEEVISKTALADSTMEQPVKVPENVLPSSPKDKHSTSTRL